MPMLYLLEASSRGATLQTGQHRGSPRFHLRWLLPFPRKAQNDPGRASWRTRRRARLSHVWYCLRNIDKSTKFRLEKVRLGPEVLCACFLSNI